MFSIESDGFVKGKILDPYGIRSKEVEQGVPLRSFPLRFLNPPPGTKSYGVVFLDYDDIPEEGFCWIHWLLANIPVMVETLPENASRDWSDLIQGRNSWMAPFPPYGLAPNYTEYYGGPAPSSPHEYEVTAYALDTLLDIRKGFFFNDLRRKMEGHILCAAVLKGVY